MHEHVSKRAKMHRNKESQQGLKQARQAYHRMEWRKDMHRVNRHHKDAHKWLHPNKTTLALDVTIQDQTHGGH